MAVSVLAAAASQTSSLVPENPQITQSSSSRSEPNLPSLSSSPRQYPTDLTGSSILEEGDETESEPANEPVTPVSGRQSQDFHALATHDIQTELTDPAVDSAASFAAVRPDTTPASKSPLTLNTVAAATPLHNPATAISRSPQRTRASSPPVPSTPNPAFPLADQEPTTAASRRTTRTGSSSSNFKRTMSSLFRRTNSNAAADKAVFDMTASGDAAAPESSTQDSNARNIPARRWSMNKSSTTTRSNTPPSPSSPLEIAFKTREQASHPTVPDSEQFFEKKKSRASTGLSLRSRAVNFIANGPGNGDAKHPHHGGRQHPRPGRRRASSFDYQKQEKPQQTDPNNVGAPERAFWGLPAETGTGVKARRMSLSLPDDFHVDVAELQAEFEYQHKLLGRHGKHLGKGATSKVILMARKGIPTEIYAVKEFRGKSSSETKEEYEKKIKSEFTLAKSLHHPNIVETIRLCTDHGRWNHVMEYCSEGDLFTLVNKKYLKQEDREKDRLCLFKQLVQGINYLHSNGIAHRDIKLENLLITSDSKLKITDFGVSEVFSGIHPGLREAGGQCGQHMGEVRKCAPGICGSEPYIAPEVLQKKGEYDPRPLDVWGAGIVMIHLIFGGCLWQRADLNSKAGNNTHYHTLVEGWEKWARKERKDPEAVGITDQDYPRVAAFDMCVRPPALRRVLLQMLHPDPNQRISIADVNSNRWVKNIECCQLESYEDPAKTIDASKKTCLNMNRTNGQRKIFCHNHLPPKEHNSHSLGKMPGNVGY